MGRAAGVIVALFRRCFAQQAQIEEPHRTLPEKPTTPDLVERASWMLDAANRQDWDGILAFYRSLCVGTETNIAA